MKQFRKAVEAGDIDALVECLAEDVVFKSPIVFRPYVGKAVVGSILRAVARVFVDFRYTSELDDGAHSALVFEAKVGNREVQGIDLIEANETGLVARLTVFVRPLSGAHALADAVKAELEKMSK
jgi:hypothetical protein